MRRFVPLDNLEEQYSHNRKRRRLLYALRRQISHSYATPWDHLCNTVRQLAHHKSSSWRGDLQLKALELELSLSMAFWQAWGRAGHA